MMFKSLKAHASRHALLTLALCTLAPLPAMANAPVFAPAAPWEVNAGQLSNVRGLKPMKMPCVISTEYDNGYVVRFSGGGGKMMALAIDFRQDVFKQGKQYDTMVTIGGAYVKQVTASAFTPSTLIFNLRPIPDFYNAAQNGGEMEIEIEGNTLKFALNNIGKTYSELEGCYGGGNAAEPVKPVVAQGPAKAPVADVESEEIDEARTESIAKKPAAKPMKEPAQKAPQPQPLSSEDIAAQPLPKEVAQKKLPQSFDEIVQNGNEEPPVQPTKLKLSQVTPKPSQNPAEAVDASLAPRAQKPAANPVPRAPEDVAEAPAAKDITPMPAAASQPKPIVSRASDDGMSTTPPIKTQGAAMASAQQPIKGFVPMTPEPVAAAPLPTPQPVAQAPTPITPPAPTVWEAKAGEDMKIVLSRWAERAGYDLQWQSGQDGKVAQDVKLNGSFEDAVGQLLAENSAATGIGAHVETTSGGKKDIGPQTASAPEPTSKGPAVQATIPALHEEWTAAPGANIQSVLDQWSSKAGVAVVWQSYMNVAVKQPLQVSGTYEEAVQSLLDQYSGDSRRPVGQLNIDPETGMRTLLVDMSS